MNTLVTAFKGILNWIRSFSFYRTKVILFTTMITAVFFDSFIKIDLKEYRFEYNNGDTPVIIIVAIIITSIVFLIFDFWYEWVKSKERMSKEVIKILKDDSMSDKLKMELLEFLRKE